MVGIFRSIVQSFVLPMLHARQDLVFSGSIALQLIGDDHAWDILESYAERGEKNRFAACVFRRLWTRISSGIVNLTIIAELITLYLV